MEFKYYADGVHSVLTPPGKENAHDNDYDILSRLMY